MAMGLRFGRSCILSGAPLRGKAAARCVGKDRRGGGRTPPRARLLDFLIDPEGRLWYSAAPSPRACRAEAVAR